MAMAKAAAAPSFTVKVVVWVMNPGPIAEVAIRNIAPSKIDRVLIFFGAAPTVPPPVADLSADVLPA